MARGKKKADGPQNGGAINPPDFEAAHRIYLNDIAPANRRQKQAMAEASEAWKEVKGHRVHKGGFRQAAKLSEMEEADQQAWLRSFKAGCEHFDVSLYADAVDRAEGVNDDTVPVVPVSKAPQAELPTMLN